ncbi:unnamed protein product [Hydatigera taeniaeformis]|uniref:TPR_REGION domain-containing protein n=1 Tax=Hydatigena taeniaeformis TaxID=6205 RepID=A0A0R3X7G0_HYDTA|nr:unnamed protein product [Hydatigera taeniaeformis]
MECMKSGSQHELVKEYFRIVHESMSKFGKKKEFLKKFGETRTDFQRVCYLLKALEATNFVILPETVSGLAAKSGIEVLGMPSKETALKGLNGKSDEVSTQIREHSNQLWKSRQATKALTFYTAALFHAASDSVKALALGNRSCVLFSLNCFDEASADASEALKVGNIDLGFPLSKAARLHIRIAQCHQIRGRLPEARKHFQEAISLLDDSEASMRTSLLSLAKLGLLECSTEQEKTMSTPSSPSEPLWKCIRYDPPKFSRVQTIKLTKASSDDKPGTSCRLLSAPDGTVRLRNTGHKRGWAVEVTRDVPVASSIQYVSDLHVGFCSSACAKSAMRADGGRDGLGRHVNDCGGLVPCLQLDSYAGWSKEVKDSVGGPKVSRLAFACIASTAPDCLLDYVCSTGRYESLDGTHKAMTNIQALPRFYASTLV